MGKRGLKPTPTALRVLRGNPGKRKLNESEVTPETVSEPIIPEYLEWLDSVAKKEWDRIAPILKELGLLTKIDGTALAGYCRVYSKWVDTEKLIMKHGMLMKTESGYIQQSPYISMANQYMKEMRRFLSEFGMTPSSRSNIKLSEPILRDEFEDYLNEQ